MSSVRHVVALGSSFAAGPGIPPSVDRAAGRSARNYPHLLAERLGARLTDLTVSGATTETLLERPQRVLLRRFPPQLAGVPADADLVTITAGGNDLGYIGGLAREALAGRFERLRATRPLGRLLGKGVPEVGDADLERATVGLVRVVAAVRERAPRARVVLVDYLTVLGPDARPGPGLPLGEDAIAGFRRIAALLEGVFAEAAVRSGAELLRAGALSVEHGVGSAEPWVTGFGHGAAFHPTADGMAAVAGALSVRHG